VRRSFHVLALLAVLFGFGVSFAMLIRVIGTSSPWLVLLLMFYFLGLTKVAEPLFMLRMPSRLRLLRPWELDGRLYRRLGVPGFGRILRQTPLRYMNTAVYLDGKHGDPLQVRVGGESAEASHFWAAVLLMPYIGIAALNGTWEVVAWFSLVQVLVNVYPIMHLRQMRGRLDKLLRRNRRNRAGPAHAQGSAQPLHRAVDA